MKKKILYKIFNLFISLQTLIAQLITPALFTFSKPVFATNTPKSEISFNKNKNSFNISVKGSGNVNYLLAYKTDKQIEAVNGSGGADGGSFVREIYAGTCSSGGTCVPHKVIRGVFKVKVEADNWLNGKQFSIENGNLKVVVDQKADSIELSEEEEHWLENGEVLAPTTAVGQVDAIIVESNSCYANSLNGCLVTDKPDYAPTEVVLIAGYGFEPGQTYTLVISSQDEPAVNFEAEIVADESGAFNYSYQLDGVYRPEYKVEVEDGLGTVLAATSFTDSNYTYTLQGLVFSKDPSDDGNWTTGNVCAGVSGCYAEGDDVPSRLTITGLTNGASYTVIIQHDYQDSAGNFGYLEFHNDTPVLPDVGASGATITYISSVSCGSGNTCLDYQLSFTALADTAVLYWDSLLSFDAAEWNGASLHFRLESGIGGENVGKKEVPIQVKHIIQLASITVIKDVVPDDSSLWDFTLTGPGGYSDGVSGIGDGGSHTFFDLESGTYVLSETTDPAYTTSVSCDSGETGTDSVGVDLDEGEDVSCTFTNTRNTSQLTVLKNVDGNNDGDLDDPEDIVGATDWTWDIADGEQDIPTGESRTLPTGSYNISEDLKNNYHLVSWFCSDGTNGETNSIPVNLTINGITCTFINAPDYGSISGLKFNDLDGDGMPKEPGEPGLPNWRIEVKDEQGAIVGFDYTDGNGNYSIDNLLPGTYSVCEITQAGWTRTYPTDDCYTGVVLNPGQNITDKDFGNFQNVSVTACKLVDADGNLETTDDREVEANWTVYLSIDGVRQQPGQLTDSGGCYTWTNLGPGHSYDVEEDVPSGWTALTPTSHDFGPAESGGDYNYTFINTPLGTIIVEKQTNPDGDPQEFTFTGDVSGNIQDGQQLQNSDLLPGIYTATELTQLGWDLTNISCDDNDSTGDLQTRTATFNLQAGETVTCTFTNTKRGSISGYKFEDVDGDAYWDGGEPTLNGWMIFLDEDADSTLDPGEVFTTTSSGAYSFTDLLPGDYDVCEVLPAGWTKTLPGLDCYYLTILPGQNLTDYNFGNFENGYISGYKYNDLNGSGERDSGDVDLDGWTIRLSYRDSSDTPDCPSPGTPNGQYCEYITGAEGDLGHYIFRDLGPGIYIVEEILLSGWIQTDPTSDDVSIGGKDDGTYEIIMTSNGAKHSRHFGNFELGKIQGRKYEDVNGNGVHDFDTEERLNGWTIRLYDESWSWLDEVTTSNTGEVGQYLFENLEQGTYYVCEVLQDDWIQTGPILGAGTVDNDYNPTGDGIAVVNNSGALDEGSVCWETTINSGDFHGWLKFGNRLSTGNLKVCKFNDLDGDGDWEEVGENDEFIEWEVGVEGQGGVERGDDGCYTWEDLPIGIYRVFETEKDGWILTTNNNPTDAEVESGGTTIVYFGNQMLLPELEITKDNDRKGDILAKDDIVTYTLTITNNGPGTAFDVILEDAQPVGDYFDYLESSGTLKLEPTGPENPVTASHVGGNRYFWPIGDMLVGQTYTLKYQLKILDTAIPGTHYNIAFARGLGIDSLTYFSNSVIDPFEIGDPKNPSAGYKGEIEKEEKVLGAATGQVLGAATGSKTFWLIVSLLMIVLGRALLKFSKSKKFAKIFKNLFLALLVILPMVNAKPIMAVDNDPPVVKIVQLPEYLNKRGFEISYTALDAGEAGLKNVNLKYKKEGGGWQDLGTYSEHSRKVNVDSSKINEDKKYYFRATACDNNSNCASDETFTNVDTSAPPKPENYSKEKIGPQSYKIKWHNPDSDDLDKVYIYRSDKKDYDANESTEVARISVSKNTDSEWVDSVVPDATKDYYYAIRSVDKAGNASELVGDTYVTTITTTEEAPAGETVTDQEVIGGQEPVAGVGAPGEGVEGEVEGKILGEEEAATEEADLKPEELKPEEELAGESFAEKIKKLPWLWIAIGGLGLIIAGYWFFGIKKE